MKTSLALAERTAHFVPSSEGFHRKSSSFLRALRKLPWPDQLALMFTSILGLVAGFALSPALMPLWSLALLKKLAAPDKTERPEP